MGELIEVLEKCDKNSEVVIEVSKKIGKKIRITLETPHGTREGRRGGIVPRDHTPLVIIETVGDQF